MTSRREDRYVIGLVIVVAVGFLVGLIMAIDAMLYGG